MKEFMILIRTEGDHLAGLPPEAQQAHVQKIGAYIGGLMESGKLKGAQPFEQEGATFRGGQGTFKDGPFTESKEVIVGYFHVTAESLEEAVQIAKANPMFEEGEATVDVRVIKQMEGIN